MQALEDTQEPKKTTLPSVTLLTKGKSWLSRIRSKIAALNFSQKCYFIAFFLLIGTVGEDFVETGDVLWAGIPAGIGLARELWHLFTRIWQHMLGKGLILVLYAATANFALALSAMKINEIVGIEPTIFVFTLGFTTLLMLPFWLLLATVVFFSLALVALNLWLILSIVLRLFRIKIQVHWEDKSFVFITMLLRLILIPSVIMTLATAMEPYTHQLAFFNSAVVVYDPDELTEEELALLQSAESGKARDVLNNIKQNRIDQGLEPLDDNEEAKQHLSKVIANFVFWFETYPKSACQKAENQRSLIIDENSMLVAEPDNSEVGFKFSVQPCIPRYPANLDAE